MGPGNAGRRGSARARDLDRGAGKDEEDALTRPAATRREASSVPGDSQGTGVSGGWQKVRPPSVGLRRLGRGCATATEGKQEGSDVIGDVPWPCARQARRWASARRKTRRTSLLKGGRERLERWHGDRGSRKAYRLLPIKASPKAETIFPPSLSPVSSRSIDRDSAIVLFFRLRAHTFRRFSGVCQRTRNEWRGSRLRAVFR